MFFTHAQKAKIWSFFCKSISIFLSRSLFPFAFLWPSGLVRISKTTYLQNEASLERSVFEEVVVYQFIPCEQRPFDLPR